MKSHWNVPAAIQVHNIRAMANSHTSTLYLSNSVAFLQLGCRVTAGAHTGIARYIGPAKFAAGDWVGIELETPDGKNDGTVNGEQVRSCVWLSDLC